VTQAFGRCSLGLVGIDRLRQQRGHGQVVVAEILAGHGLHLRGRHFLDLVEHAVDLAPRDA